MPRARDSNGFTIFTPLGTPYYGYNPADTDLSRNRIICLSKSVGFDAEGTAAGQGIGSPAKPYASIAKGLTRIRGLGTASDWLLLDNRDTWTDETVGDLSQYPGISPDNPTIIATWDRLASNNPPIPNPGTGGARAILKCAHGAHPITNCHGRIAILGIQLYAYTRDPGNPAFNPAGVQAAGITVGQFCNDFLVEDCEISYFTQNLDTQCDPNPPANGGANIWIRRNIVHHAYDTIGNVSKGIGAGNCRPNYRLEENFVDECGWNRALGNMGSSLNHNLYLTAGNHNDGTGHWMDAHIIGNISSWDNWDVQIRCGGNLYNNLWFMPRIDWCGLGLSNADITMSQDSDVFIGNQWSPSVSSEWESVGGRAYDPGNNEYWALTTMHITRTIFTQGNNVGWCLRCTGDHGYDNLFTIDNCIGWKVGILIENSSGLLISQSNNRQGSTPADAITFNWPHPDRTPATYMDEVIFPGTTGHTYQDYLNECYKQRKGFWRPLLMAESVDDYIRQGFGMPMMGSAYASLGGGVFLNPLPTSGTVGVAYSGTVSASGGVGPYTYAVTAGALPAGLTLNTSSGAVSGTPTTAGTFNFTIRATDSTSTQGTRAYNVAIAAGSGSSYRTVRLQVA